MIHKLDGNLVESLFKFCKSNKDNGIYICDSEDIHEELEHGDYLYYYIPYDEKSSWFLYMESTHPWGLPNRIIQFSDSTQLYAEEWNSEIVIIPSNPQWSNAVISDGTTSTVNIARLKELLESSDRPKIGRVI